MIKISYSLLIYPLMWLAFLALSLVNSKIKEGFKLRRTKDFWKKSFDSTLPVYWFHVASGEFEYAKPVIRELKRKLKCTILVTYFSPSVLKSLQSTSEVDIAVPTPWDTWVHWRQFIKHYKPQCLAIARTDLWPMMIWQARSNKIRTVLFSATLPSHSPRVASLFGRLFYSFIVEALDHISVVNAEDESNFRRILHSAYVTQDGDTRFDQVFYRLENTPLAPEVETIKNFLPEPQKVFIAGSTWPEDEAVLVPALKTLVSEGYKILLAPHEVHEHHLNHLEKQLSGLRACRLSQPDNAFDVLIIDKVGILAQLYKLGEVAFVGGSFKKSIHSVMEPAAAGCLTLVGPYHYNSREALLLKSKGFVQEFGTSQQLVAKVLSRKSNSEGIREFARSQRGVSRKVAEFLVGPAR